MCKQKFLSKLRKKLHGLPPDEINDRIEFYSEMIDDRMEEGFSEEDAIASIGSTDEIVYKIIEDTPITKIVGEKLKKKSGLNAWQIILIALGSPIWISLAVAALSVIISLYVALWSVIISLWSAFAAFALSAPCGIIAGITLALSGDVGWGIAIIGAAVACAGLAIFTFFGCRAATKGAAWLTKTAVFGIKRLFVKEEKTR